MPCWPVIGADQWPEPRDRGTERILRYERCELISQVQRPQQLRCMEKMKTLMFGLTSKQSTGLPARRRYSYYSMEKMKNSVNTEGGNYSNAGLSIKPPPKYDIKTAGLVRLTWFKGDYKISGRTLIIVDWMSLPTHIYIQISLKWTLH